LQFVVETEMQAMLSVVNKSKKKLN